MHEKRTVKPFRPIYPSPAAIIGCCDEQGRPNLVTLAECFNVSIASPVIVGIAIRTATYSHGLIRRVGEFTVNLPTTKLLAAVDGVGSVSGRQCADKFAAFGLTPLAATKVRPPLVAECPLNLECRVLTEHEVGDHQLFLGEVLAEHVDEDLLDAAGNIDASRLDPVCYVMSQYWALGPRLGEHGLSKKRRKA